MGVTDPANVVLQYEVTSFPHLELCRSCREMLEECLGRCPVSVKKMPCEERLVRSGLVSTDRLSYIEVKLCALLGWTTGKLPTDLARGGDGRLMDLDLDIACGCLT